MVEMIEDKLFLPSDMQRDEALLTASIAQKSYRYVICFGQKPVLQNKVKIERRAFLAGHQGDWGNRVKFLFWLP